MVAYGRVFNYGTAQALPAAMVNRNFHRQRLGSTVAVGQYFRDLLIGEVIRGGQLIDQRLLGSVATIQRIGLDLRYAHDRSTYGNVFTLAIEAGHYLVQAPTLPDAADIRKAFDANTKWDVAEIDCGRSAPEAASASEKKVATCFCTRRYSVVCSGL
jgi:hypothetical protein